MFIHDVYSVKYATAYTCTYAIEFSVTTVKKTPITVMFMMHLTCLDHCTLLRFRVVDATVQSS